MLKYQNRLKILLKEKLNLENVIFTIPPNTEVGDIALPCFTLAKEFRKSPMQIANEIKEKLVGVDFIDKMEVSNGYLNFYMKKPILIEEILKEIKNKRDLYGASEIGIGKKALIEHTSINPNASPHVGRARNAIIGDSLVRILKFEGYEVNTCYFVNDIGKQIAMLLFEVGDRKDVGFKDLLNIYVDINNKIEVNPELEEEVFKLLYKLENGDKSIKEGFRRLVDICIKGQMEIFNSLGINYDTFTYESDYIWNNRLDKILEQFKATNKLEEDIEGRLVLNQAEYNLPMKAPYLVLTRKDKTSLYPLRDIAYTIDKMSSNAEKNIVVLGEDQKLYFQQVKAALDLLGFKAPEPVHYSFVNLTDGKMSTRKGNVVLLEDFMQEALLKAESSMQERYESYDKNTARAIAYGAVKYAFLKIANEKNVTFDWSTALSFEGDSGPYLQYSYARIKSILRKYNKPVENEIDYSVLSEPVEYELIKEMANLEEVVSRALNEASPSVITNYAYSIAKKFSFFYHNCPVLNAGDESLIKARILLIDAVGQVIENCLELLGIEKVEVM